MDIVHKLVNCLHPGQTPIISMDQPFHAICNNIQWVFGGTYSEDAFVVMLGRLHIEITLLRLLGEWLTDSGWTTALTEPRACTYDRADAVRTEGFSLLISPVHVMYTG